MRPYCIQHRELYLELFGDLSGKEIQKRQDICIHIVDLLCYTAEANTTLKINYTPVIINLKNNQL